MPVSEQNPSSSPLFEINDLTVTTADGETEILKHVNLTIKSGELHALMGPNGSGKSTLASTLLGNPEYEVIEGTIRFKDEDITSWPPEERGQAGLFLAFQYPQEIPGVSVRNFLTQALQARKGTEVSTIETYVAMQEWMQRLSIDSSFMDRYLNEKFSGGEKKRNEILQMAVLEPEIAILDETDTGLDIDALRVVANGVESVRSELLNLGVLVITHFQRLLTELQPDHVHVMIDGQIVRSGGIELAEHIEREGYEQYELSKL
ncbi:MAG: Fe-S cluster assembly ATPase SufC [Acidimicrobiaceae bacterium]|nr:Fe-S cluster assembly ATPase SufC [Acidimicrobiaceae bacterium]